MHINSTFKLVDVVQYTRKKMGIDRIDQRYYKSIFLFKSDVVELIYYTLL